MCTTSFWISKFGEEIHALGLAASERTSAQPADPLELGYASRGRRMVTQMPVSNGWPIGPTFPKCIQRPGSSNMVETIVNALSQRLGSGSMQMVDLRQLSSWQLEPLLAEEAQQWRDELRWDYRASTELIKKFLDARSLTGSALLESGRPIGYAFYVLEDHKGLVGGLFVSPRFSQQELSQRLLTDTLTTLSGIPKLERIEAQLIPFGYQLDPVLTQYGFRLYMRQFMIAPLAPPGGPAEDVVPGVIREGPGAGLILERWDHRYFEPCARLIQLAYANHVDGEINDQYRSVNRGALRFLKNIIILPGCGAISAGSFVRAARSARQPSGRRNPEFARSGRSGAHHADLRHARVSGPRARPPADGSFAAGPPSATFQRGLSHRNVQQRARGSPVRKTRVRYREEICRGGLDSVLSAKLGLLGGE